MQIDEVWLSHGIQANEDIASFAALWPALHPDGKIEVTLAVGAEAEHEYPVGLDEIAEDSNDIAV